MTVDMTKIQVGDTVHFRCGGSVVVKRAVSVFRSDFVSLSYEGGDFMQTVTHDGKFYQGNPHIFDIIRVTQRALTPEDRLEKIAEIIQRDYDGWQIYLPTASIRQILDLARDAP